MQQPQRNNTNHTAATVRHWLRAEFLNGRTAFDWCFFGTGILLQIIIYCWVPQSALAFVSALSGICSVILCSQKKISSFFFGFLQVTTYTILALQENLYAEVAQNVFYFLTMIYGVFVWWKHYAITADDSSELQTRRLSAWAWMMILIVVIALSFLTGWLLRTYTDDSQPYLDAFTTVPAVLAQILMILGYREQWFFWLLIDIGLTVIWMRAGNWCLTVQHIFWCINCIYGFLIWSKNKSV